MTHSPPMENQVLSLLRAQRAGNDEARHELFALLYQELRQMAWSQMSRERVDHTLLPTSLVHEVFLRLERAPFDCQDRQEFLRLASRVMRNVLVDSARRRQRRSDIDAQLGQQADPSSYESVGAMQQSDPWILALEEALQQLQQLDAETARIVELRFMLDMSVEEVSRVLECSTATVKRRWRAGKAWLQQAIEGMES